MKAKVSTLQTPLFADALFAVAPEPVKPIERRHAAAKAVFDKENELFKQYFVRFALEFAGSRKEFKPEDVRHAYKVTKLPQPRNWRSAGQIFKTLAAEGELIFVEMGISREFGCPTPVYRKGDK